MVQLGTFFTRSAGLGMDLRPYLGTGQLQVRQIELAELSPGEFVHYVRRAVEGDGARVVVIDSLNGNLLRDFEGVLSGTPVYRGSAGALWRSKATALPKRATAWTSWRNSTGAPWWTC